MGSLLINKRPGSLDIKPASQSKPFRINDFIFLSEGASNSYLIETAEGNILINTGLGVEAPIHKYCFDQINNNQIKYIIYTQGHVDHVGGSGFFKEYNPDATLIAQENIIEHQSFDLLTQGGRALNAYKFFGEMIDLMNDSIARAEKMGFKDIQSIAEPDILFQDEYKQQQHHSPLLLRLHLMKCQRSRRIRARSLEDLKHERFTTVVISSFL